jgi:hypothetical protein
MCHSDAAGPLETKASGGASFLLPLSPLPLPPVLSHLDLAAIGDLLLVEQEDLFPHQLRDEEALGLLADHALQGARRRESGEGDRASEKGEERE